MTVRVNLVACVAPPFVNSNKGNVQRFIALRVKSHEKHHS